MGLNRKSQSARSYGRLRSPSAEAYINDGAETITIAMLKGTYSHDKG
jgi:hypothetical protein